MEEEERHKKLEAGKVKFAEFLQKKKKNPNAGQNHPKADDSGSNVSEEQRIESHTNVGYSAVHSHQQPDIINIADSRHLNHNHHHNHPLIGGPFTAEDDEKENVADVWHLKEVLKQRDDIIRQLSERLQATLSAKNDVFTQAEAMSRQVEELKEQLRFVSSSLLSNYSKSRAESSVEGFRRDVVSSFGDNVGFNASNSLQFNQTKSAISYADKGEQASLDDEGVVVDSQSSPKDFEDKPGVDVNVSHSACVRKLEEEKVTLAKDFVQRETQTELALLEEVEKIENQMKLDRRTYIEESNNLDQEICRLKERVRQLEERRESRSLSQSPSPASPNNSTREGSQSPTQEKQRMSSESPKLPSLPRYAAQTNSRLLHVLSDLVKAFLDTESDIQRHLERMGFTAEESDQKEEIFPSLEDVMERLSQGESNNDLCEDGPDLMTPAYSFIPGFTANSSASVNPATGGSVEDDVVLGASRRLRSAVDRILHLLGQIVASHHEHDVQELFRRNEELASELKEEVGRREKLTTELIQNENLVKSLEKRKMVIEEQLDDYHETKRQLKLTEKKVVEYESEREKWRVDTERLRKDQTSFAEGLPRLQQTNITNASDSPAPSAQDTKTHRTLSDSALPAELVTDNDTLNKDVRQLQQEKVKLLQRVHSLEVNVEQLRNERDEALEEKRRECEDLVAQLEASEKQITSYRRFVEEQTIERETEREEFNKEFEKMREKLREREKIGTKIKDDLDSIETQLASILDDKQYVEKKNQELQAQLKVSNDMVAELKGVLGSLEKESEKGNQTEKRLKAKVNELEEALRDQLQVNHEMRREQMENSTLLANSILGQITAKTKQIENSILTGGNVDDVSISIAEETTATDISGDNSYIDAHTLDSRLKQLNECIDKLVSRNTKLQYDLQDAKETKEQLQHQAQEALEKQLRTEVNLKDVSRANEILQQEVNTKHLQLSSFKARLDSSVALDVNQLKLVVEELKSKLMTESQRCQNVQQRLNLVNDENEEKKMRINELIEELNSLRETGDNKRLAEAKKAIEDQQQLIRTINDLREQLERLKKEKTEHEEVKQQLLRQQKQNLHKEAVEKEEEIVLPQLLQMIINDKNEEIACLSQQLNHVQRKLSQAFPSQDHVKESLDYGLVDELVRVYGEYNKLVEVLQQKEQSERAALSSSPKRVILKEKATSTPCLASKETEEKSVNTSNESISEILVQVRRENETLLEEVNQYKERLTQMCYSLTNFEEENDILKHQIEMMKESSTEPDSRAFSTNGTNTPDTEGCPDDGLKDALQKLHNNSMEVLKLSECHKCQDMVSLRQVIECLPFAVSDEPDFGLWKDQIADHFSDQDIGRLFVENVTKINQIYGECKRKAEFYKQKFESVCHNLEEVEKELRLLQETVNSYREKYSRLKEETQQLQANWKSGQLERQETAKAPTTVTIGDNEDLARRWKKCVHSKRALIYQKKYLLNVLGGFQLTEKATLALLANMNVTIDDSSPSQSPRSRFKSAVFVVIALSRMKFLVRKWNSSVNNNQILGSKKTGAKQRTSSVSSPWTGCRSIENQGRSEYSNYSPKSSHQTNTSLDQFVTRLQRLHNTLGLNSASVTDSPPNQVVLDIDSSFS